MSSPGPFHGKAVDLGGAGPALGGTQNDHRPAGPLRLPLLAGGALNSGDTVRGGVHGLGHRAVDGGRLVSGDVDGLVSVSLEEFVEFGLRKTGQHGGIGDLVAVEVQDRQDGTVPHGVQELVRVPGGGQRPRLRLTVTDDTGDQQAGVVEGGTVGVREGVSEFPALVDGAGRLRGHVAGDASGERELPEQPGHPGGVPGDVRVGLRVRPFQPGIGHHGGAAVTGPPDAEGFQPPGADESVEVCVHEVEAR